VEDLVDDRVEQLDVVADDDQPAGVLGQEAAQPGDRVGVEVVGRLVEQQRRGVGEQDAGQLDAAALTAGQRAELLAERPLGQAEVRADAGRLGLGGVAAERVKRSSSCRTARAPRRRRGARPAGPGPSRGCA
jgi:hypothetical protein